MSQPRVVPVVAALILSAPAQALGQTAPSSALKIARIEDSVIVLTDGRRWEPGLYGITHVYTLQIPGGVPFFVLNGVGCQECDGEYGLYVLRFGEHLDW